LTIAKPDDWHLHLRDGSELAAVVAYTARAFARAIVMPNLRPPVATVALAARYRDRIRAALPAGSPFEPLMTLYLTDTTDPAEIDRAADSGFVAGVKCYPAGATTHSDAGVRSLRHCEAVLARMEERDVVLQVHAEATGDDVDPFDRESVFIERELVPLVARHPRLRVVLEHVTTCAGVEFVRSAPGRVGATITPQHLLYNRARRPVPRRTATPPLLPAGPEARARPAGARRGGHLGRCALFPGHGQRAARALREGDSLRLRGHFLGAGRDRAVCTRLRRGRAPREPRGIRQSQRRGLLRACAEPRDDPARAPPLDGSREPALRRR
jgi:hypothetical protein